MGKHEVIVVTSPTEVIPSDIDDLIGKPSLLGTEIQAEFEALFHRLAGAVKPNDAVEWIWVADVTHLVWEMRRLRGMRDGIVERETAGALGDVVWDILSGDYDHDKMFDVRDRLVSHWNSGNAFRRQIVQRFLMRRGLDFSQIHAEIYRRRLDELGKLEVLIANLGRRRDSVLREIEHRRDTVARRLRNVTDAEFEITKPGTRPVGD